MNAAQSNSRYSKIIPISICTLHSKDVTQTQPRPHPSYFRCSICQMSVSSFHKSGDRKIILKNWVPQWEKAILRSTKTRILQNSHWDLHRGNIRDLMQLPPTSMSLSGETIPSSLKAFLLKDGRVGWVHLWQVWLNCSKAQQNWSMVTQSALFHHEGDSEKCFNVLHWTIYILDLTYGKRNL